MLDESEWNKEAKYKLVQFIRYHQEECLNVYCYCRRVKYIFETSGIKSDRIFAIVDDIFSDILKNPILLKNSDDYEHMSLKYISYLSKYRENSPKSYYELKMLLA